MGKKIEIDKKEIDEIINLRISELDGNISKLTYNSVWKLNERISKDENYKRYDGKNFTSYGYHTWAGKYKNEYGYGKIRIDEIKNKAISESEQNNENNLGIDTDYLELTNITKEEFISSMNDIVMLVNDLHNEPEVLTRRLIKVFKRSKRTVLELEKENKELKEKLSKEEDKNSKLEKGVTNLFFASTSPNNSMENMMNLSKSEDAFTYDELKNMFNSDEERIRRLIRTKQDEKNDKLLDISTKLKKKDRIKNLGI
ncbi:hypothetical protein [Paraclostridium bifermentans]|uniref:hypothetical protein n=1 Tax=Paraclostridium bifermentans TaxID=1490 RepID=UPI001FF35DAD|nr:hypothetical protein [Paraclostridium bifermentans]UOW66785.1 hypothetical protein MTR78_09500 [Paraclostridium bifermentans]